ncbi:hypothetical protein [Parafrankia sp. EUN1f]|uniref:hypothetical protein n=1 Tax=Parafrankia sp. EUN1f TaxID=102897 RepID=UPI0001C456A1|nr:hypothetical protein [Parafrankia sp. EUN1f]EFC78878.1 hypothetical protein FrEUN1fDRAFT_8003 [Parafrankia sp. EUN1f]
MCSETLELVGELRELRRGRGARSDDLPARTGPRLRLFCGIADHDSPGQLRKKLVAALAEQCERLPSDLRLAVLAAFALHDEAGQKFLHERMEWLAGRLGRDPRTARRRVDEGLRLLAESIGAHAAVSGQDAGTAQAPGTDTGQPAMAGAGTDTSSPFVSDGWYVSSMRSVLHLDEHPLKLVERRMIIATVDRLDSVVCALSIPFRWDAGNARPAVTVAIPHGGRILEEKRPSARHTRVVVALPRALAAGEAHEFGVEFTIESPPRLLPYYAVTPLRRYDQVRARVCFGAAGRPARVWKINGVPPRVVEEFLPGDEPLLPDEAGEVRVGFTGLRPGLSYGLAWAAV